MKMRLCLEAKNSVSILSVPLAPVPLAPLALSLCPARSLSLSSRSSRPLALLTSVLGRARASRRRMQEIEPGGFDVPHPVTWLTSIWRPACV